MLRRDQQSLFESVTRSPMACYRMNEYLVPKNLYHYFDQSTGPFRNLSSLNLPVARLLQSNLNKKIEFFASKRSDNYIKTRFELEHLARELFIKSGGNPILPRPYTMTLGPCEWLKLWYPNPDVLQIELNKIDSNGISFTYGDLFPAFKCNDNCSHYQKVFHLSELPELISTFGIPQQSNPNGEKGPKRYIEAQIWTEEIIGNTIKSYF